MTPKFYRKKPLVISAIQYTGKNGSAICQWANGMVEEETVIDSSYLLISTLEGMMQAREGDYIIKGIEGEFYPCKPDIFRFTYEEVEKVYDVPWDSSGVANRP